MFFIRCNRLTVAAIALAATLAPGAVLAETPDRPVDNAAQFPTRNSPMNEASFVGVARRQLNIFLAAVMFLTRLPVGRFHEFREEDVASSTIYFPVVGALIGLAGGLALLTSAALPSFVAVLVSMLVTIFLTGGLHEDGLADSADGLIGGQDPQRRLEIMKDSRIGAYGALALWFSLTAKLFLVRSLLVAFLSAASLPDSSLRSQ